MPRNHESESVKIKSEPQKTEAWPVNHESESIKIESDRLNNESSDPDHQSQHRNRETSDHNHPSANQTHSELNPNSEADEPQRTTNNTKRINGVEKEGARNGPTGLFVKSLFLFEFSVFFAANFGFRA